MVVYGMVHLSGTDRAQLLLLPEAVDDYIGPHSPERFASSPIFMNALLSSRRMGSYGLECTLSQGASFRFRAPAPFHFEIRNFCPPIMDKKSAR